MCSSRCCTASPLNKFLKHDRGIRECARRALRGGGPPYNTILLFGYLL